MTLRDTVDVLMILVEIGAVLSVIFSVPVFWDLYQREQIKKRRNPS